MGERRDRQEVVAVVDELLHPPVTPSELPPPASVGPEPSAPAGAAPLSDARFRANVEALYGAGLSQPDLGLYLGHVIDGRDLLAEREAYQAEQLAEETRRKSRDGGVSHRGVRTTADIEV